ncbi:MAG TPA: NAD(P)H-binding protein [Mycobacteriales bacterium]|nr:NAD(P)H-binding protein [Mycobacteriales bacterium]
MRITVFGATGNVGSRVVHEARSRGHHVTAVSRSPKPGTQAGNAADPETVAALSSGQDLVISATRPAAGSEGDLVAAAHGLLAGLAGTGVRLLVVGGAGSLTTPGDPARLLIDDPAYVPPAWRPIAQACNDQLAAFRADRTIDWTYLSPAAILEPGERTGTYRLGADELIIDAAGRSAISMEDLAVALLDEAERPRHRRTRFTVSY